MPSEYVIDLRAVNRTCSYIASGKIKPAVMTAVGGGTQVNLRIGHSGGTVAAVSRFNPATPGTAGWAFAR